MDTYSALLDKFTFGTREILKDNLVGIYLHGSAVMECFHPQKSDIDLLVVIKNDMSHENKRAFMDMVVELNQQAPEKGIELSVIKEEECNPFVYPTPFELHFSIAHLSWYLQNPEDYIEKMNGMDKDLAAHCTILYHRGKMLYGKEIREVFGKVKREAYFDSIWCDIENAKEDILDNPMYIILNLCRVLAYKEEGLILSKKEGGEWGLNRIREEKYAMLIRAALREYETAEAMMYEKEAAVKYAEYMLEKIKLR